jgi:Transposase DDE domain
MGLALGHALAGHAGALRQVQDNAQALHALGGDRGMGPGLCRSTQGPGKPVCDDRFQRRSRSSTGRDGAKKRASETALGRSRGGLTTKIHLLADELGLPLGFVLTGGQTHDSTQAIALLGERRPEAVLADKGYDTDSIL